MVVLPNGQRSISHCLPASMFSLLMPVMTVLDTCDLLIPTPEPQLSSFRACQLSCEGLHAIGKHQIVSAQATSSSQLHLPSTLLRHSITGVAFAAPREGDHGITNAARWRLKFCCRGSGPGSVCQSPWTTHHLLTFPANRNVCIVRIFGTENSDFAA